jgi:hypothetical protein
MAGAEKIYGERGLMGNQLTIPHPPKVGVEGGCQGGDWPQCVIAPHCVTVSRSIANEALG